MDREFKRKQKITIMGIIGVVMLLIGTSFAVFTANLSGTKNQSINTGCLKVQMSDSGDLSLANSLPVSDSDGLSGTPYTYTLTNTCTVDAFYTSTLNISSSSNLANLSKVKVALNGDSYLKPTFMSNLSEVELVDSSETGVSKTYKIDEGYIAPGDTKTFNLRSWIDYDVEEFTGNVVSKVIVKSEARGNSMVAYKTNTAGYTALKSNDIINNAAYNLTAPSANQTTGIVRVGDKYYYRGNPTNNYVSFAGKTWRVLSTNSDGSVNIVLNNTTTSTSYSNITSALNAFYSSISSEEEYIKTDSKFCEEKTSSGSYVALTRLEGNKPSTECESNNYMTKIGLLSVDDLMYAGAAYGSNNNSFYLASNSSYWTNSWNSSSKVYNYTTSAFSSTSTSSSLALKPVITLKANTLLEGEGTSASPYYVNGTYDNADSNYSSSDSDAPTIIYARVDDRWSNQNKNIEISASDEKGVISGYYIGTTSTKPGTSATGWEASSSLKYTSVNAYDNGTYYVFVKDNNDNVSDGKEVVISKIDKVNPTCTINVEAGSTITEYKTLKVIGEDQSGIDPNGYSWNLSDEKNDVIKADMKGDYVATVTDMAGNKGTCTTTVGKVDDKTGYEVNVVVENGTVENSSRYIEKGANVSFNLIPNNPNHLANVSCTNNQKGVIENNVLTIKKISAPTICTVNYDEASTVLYEDGTLIINELLSDRASNISKHGAVTNTYNPLSDSDSYVMESEEDQPWYNEEDEISSVIIASNINPASTAWWFSYLSYASYGDFTKIDTSNVTDMNSMFFRFCYFYDGGVMSNDLTKYDASYLGDLTSKAKKKKLINLPIPSSLTLIGLDDWDTRNVEYMNYMFGDIGSIYNYQVIELDTWSIGDLSNWNVSNVTDMSHMFDSAGHSATTWSIGDLSNWNVSNVTDMSWMFDNAGFYATTFEIGDLSNWNVSNVTDMDRMFHFAWFDATTWSIGDLSNWNVSNVTDMSYMFGGAGHSATTWSIGDLSNWNVSNVTDMDRMFAYAGKSGTNAELYITNWNPTNVTDMSSMFESAGFETIYCNYDWNSLSNITDSGYMFYDASNLVGGSGTTYSSSHVDKAYARPDSSGTPGYFTFVQQPESFATDSYDTIVAAVQSDNTSVYHVGDTKCIALNGYTTTNDNGCENGEFALRIANKSTPTECNTQGFSQTACGFVLEFADIITSHNMNPSGTYKGINFGYGWNVDGWPASSMREFVSTDIYNALPSDLKNAIIDTTVVSGHGSTSGEVNFTSTDKIYLLSAHEVWEDGTSNKVSSYDTAWDNTRQLDYYNELGVTTNNYSGTIKKRNSSVAYWLLRSANSNNNYNFLHVGEGGDWSRNLASESSGVSPAFRLG